MSIIKQCTKCGGWKLFTEFSRDSRKKDGYRSDCKVCHSKWYKENPNYNQQYYETNREKWDEYEQRRRANPSFQQERIETNRRYREKHPERIKEITHRWNSNHPEKIREKVLAWEKKNPGKRLQYGHNRRAKIKGSGGKITAEEWEALKDFYNHTCLCCGRKEPEIKLELDHVVSISQGGVNVISNAQCLCRSCNATKSAKHIDYRPIIFYG